MSPKLIKELLTALSQSPAQPLRYEDPETQQAFYIISADTFDQMQKHLSYDDSDLTPEEMMAAAQHGLDDPEGWDAPGMESYDQDNPTNPS